MTAYFVGDKPSEALRLAPTRDGEEVDLTGFTAVVTVDGTPLTTSIVSGMVQATWPVTSLFTEEGLLPVQVVLTKSGVRESFDVEPLVVQDFTGWHTLASARKADASGWARQAADVALYTILSAARIKCETFAPEVAEDAALPLRYRQAQLLESRDLWNVAKVSSSGELGEDSYALTVRPIGPAAKALLRPQRGRPLVG